VAVQKAFFSVQLGDNEAVTFEEVTGLQAEAKVMEYRNGNSSNFSTTKMSELSTAGTVTMKNGTFAKDTKFFAWYQETKTRDSFTRRVVVINLLDESGNPKITWTLNNAWPRDVTGTDFKADGNEVVVESIEIAYETLEVRSTQ
jgi:phage tail-like protein